MEHNLIYSYIRNNIIILLLGFGSWNKAMFEQKLKAEKRPAG